MKLAEADSNISDVDDYGDGPAVPLPLSLFIEYSDAAGQPSERRISVRNLKWSKGRVAINAWCHEREAPRCFIAERVETAVDSETGEILSPLPDWFQTAYSNHPIGGDYLNNARVGEATLKRRQALSDAVLVLVYVAKADGRMTAVERQAIVAFIERQRAAHEDLAKMFPMADDQIKRMSCDHSEFLRAVRGTKAGDPRLRSAVIEAAKAVMEADGKEHESEHKALAWIQRSLS